MLQEKYNKKLLLKGDEMLSSKEKNLHCEKNAFNEHQVDLKKNNRILQQKDINHQEPL